MIVYLKNKKVSRKVLRLHIIIVYVGVPLNYSNNKLIAVLGIPAVEQREFATLIGTEEKNLATVT